MPMFNPPHPGEIIADIMETVGLSLRELARALDVSPSSVQRVVSGKAAVSPEMAVRLAAVLGSTPEMWLRLQSSYSLEKVQKEIDVSHLVRLEEAAEAEA